jgi:hypothetical protein
VHTHRLEHGSGTYRETGVWSEVIETEEPWPISIPIAEISGF